MRKSRFTEEQMVRMFLPGWLFANDMLGSSRAEKFSDILPHWATIMRRGGWWFPLEDVCFVSERMSRLRLDAQRHAHAVGGHYRISQRLGRAGPTRRARFSVGLSLSSRGWRMKRCVLIIASSWLIASVVSAQDVVDKYSGISLPAALGKLRRTEVTDDEATHPGLGIGAAYDAPGLKATIYIYTLGQKSIPNGVESQILKASYEAAKNDLRKASELGIYTLTSDIKSRSSYLIPGSKAVPVLLAEFSYRQKGAEFSSWLYMTGAGNQIIKLRLSSLTGERRAVEPKRRGFLAAVADLLPRQSSSAAGAVPGKVADADDAPYDKPLVHDVSLAKRYGTCAGRLMAYATLHDDKNVAKKYLVKGSAYMLLAGTLDSLDAAKATTMASMNESAKTFDSLRAKAGQAAVDASFEEQQRICSFEGVPNKRRIEDYFNWVLRVSAKQDSEQDSK
jgi:hypothetical protein